MSEREQIAGLLDVIERRFAELNEQPMALATRWHAEDGEREVQKLRQLLVEALTAPAPAAPTEAVKSSGIFGFIDIDARNALRDAELLATMAQPAPAPAAPTEANEYTTVETACRGCMGPCGRCEELASPSQGVRLDDLKSQICSSLEYWRDLLSRNNVQGFACDMLEDFDSLVNPVREGK